MFQQDGAPCHMAKITRTWFQDHNILLLKYTFSNPDLSSIKTLGHNMKKQLRKNPACTVSELRATLQNIWDNISPEECASLVDTIPSRIKAVIANKGDVTQY
ncbi:hypothetical protein ILUMI_18588 [Ignelater luminosus]|uniref:Uncharacterized protein n=1 Tax=Ignelater luminosus TaxID=2038154 RepID=A0A8K0CHX8_IGNLU|nr:hypothetical protein ILUMI_18588 [Ignelater luminosus]